MGTADSMGAEAPLASRVLAERYRIGPLLGRGGMAEVYDGYDERLHRPVAVKLLRPDVAADPAIRSRFEVEARSAACLSHPNVVAVFDTGEDAGTPFIVMERLPGETLADRMAAAPVDQAWLGDVADDVLGALGAAHAAGLVHRDVKPGNILITENGRAKVADFGIAKSMEVATDLTGTGLLMGTPAYLAPERIEGHPATERSDLYSLGVLLYEALAGAKPFDGPTPVAVAHAVLHSPHRPLAERRPDVDPALASAVEWAMTRDPAGRPSSAPELARAIAGELPSPSPHPTVALPGTLGVAPGAADATLVGAPELLRPAAGAVAEGGAVLAGEAAPSPAARGGPAVSRPRWASARRASLGTRAALLAGGALVVVLLLLVLAGRGGPGGRRAALAADIHDLAGRVEVGDGAQGPEASERLDQVADEVKAGGGADDANALLRDAGQWARDGRLSAAATGAMATVLARIDGVDPALATPPTEPTVATTAVAPATQPPSSAPEQRRPGKKGEKGQDD